MEEQLRELKIQMLSQGFTFREESPIGSGIIIVQVGRLDSDNLLILNEHTLSLLSYSNIGTLLDIYKGIYNRVTKALHDRHNQNPNTCAHSYVRLVNTKGCVNCMGKFGTMIDINFDFN